MNNSIIVFDLDGVITSEEAYWDTAGLVLHELLYSPRYWNIDNTVEAYQPVTAASASRELSRSVLLEAAIVGFKARSINSNWDTCYCGFCLYLIHLLTLVADKDALLPLRPADDDWIAVLRAQLKEVSDKKIFDPSVLSAIDGPLFQGYIGVELIERFNNYASEVLGKPIDGVFTRYSQSWKFCSNLFQEWYLGDDLYLRDYGHLPQQTGKYGCIHFEEPLLPVATIHATLEMLVERGYTLGVATGRPRHETMVPLAEYDLLKYFDAERITTHAEVAKAEAEQRMSGKTVSLVKPHPYQFLLAAHPEYQYNSYSHSMQPFVVVGDTPSDMNGGRMAGAITVAVLTGARTADARLRLERSSPDFIIDDVTKLPNLMLQVDDLATIQKKQFTEREKAERLLRFWFVRHMHIAVEDVTLTPKAVSLNSFNGLYRVDGEEYFFKTHVEEQGVLAEYYHAGVLRNAGYNIVKPLQTLHENGQQMVIYPVVYWPVMFDLMRSVETEQATDAFTAHELVKAEQRECEHLLAIYTQTLARTSAEENAQAPIHQLFWHRLTGGRLASYYSGTSIAMPPRRGRSELVPYNPMAEEHSGDDTIPFATLLSYTWRINGVQQRYTLGELIERAIAVLEPLHEAFTIIGHGDAHFGNVFLENRQDYLYFDPAFAGRHSPLLDVVKPLFHNVFATWMYFPQEIVQTLQVQVSIESSTLFVEHNYRLPAVRQAILNIKQEYLLAPLLARLRENGVLPGNWQEVLQSALMCCPLLTMNLLDTQRMPNSIAWLGFAFAVFMGNNDITFKGSNSWNWEER